MTVSVSGPDRLAYSYQEIAVRLGCSARTVWQLVNDGELRAVRIGRLVRIPRSELERFLAERLTGQPIHHDEGSAER